MRPEAPTSGTSDGEALVLRRLSILLARAKLGGKCLSSFH